MTAPRPPRPLIHWADWLMERNPGHRFEIIDGVLVVTPLPDGPHAEVLTDVMRACFHAGIGGADTEVLLKIGLWLPTGPEDYAIPDLSVVDADIDAHMVENNCYSPACFRMVLEVTSENPDLDLRHKVRAYAAAGIPVYVVVDRRDECLRVLTEPTVGGYENHQFYAPGQSLVLPDSIGAEVILDATEILAAGRRKKSG